MLLNDYYFMRPDVFRFRALNSNSVDPDMWQVGEEVFLSFHGDAYYLHQSNSICPIEAISSDDLIRNMVTHGNSLWLLRRQKAGFFDLQVTEASVRVGIDMQIGVDERVVERLVEKKEITLSDMNLALKWLAEEFILDGFNGDKRTFASYYDQEGGANFQILGRRWCAGIARPQNAPARLVSLMRLTSQQMVPGLLEGNIEFIDFSQATRLLDPVTQLALERALSENSGGYLELWKEYGRIEWQNALKVARELGELYYSHVKPDGDEFIEWRFTPKSQESYELFRERWRSLDLDLEEGIELEVAQEAPAWLHAPDVNIDPLDLKDRKNSLHGKIVFDKNFVILRPDEKFKLHKPGEKGVLYISLAGHITVQQRRERAKQTIDRGARLPQLRYLLEGISLPAVVRGFARQKLEAITPYARAIFHDPPTDKQKQAISAALNTPDIAIIVGPPGTGKTQVIAAIQRRLAEERRDQPLQHHVLISSFQHEAVENALSRTEVFGLPPVKVGLRSRRTEDSGLDPVLSWCKRKKAEVATKLIELEAKEPHIPLLKKLSHEITILRVSHLSPADRSDRLLKIDDLLTDLVLCGLRLPLSLRDAWTRCLKKRANINNNEEPKATDAALLRFVRGLRVTLKGFADDGPDRTWRCLQAIERSKLVLLPSHLSQLKLAADAVKMVDSSTLTALSEIKEWLLDNLIPDYRPPAIKNLIEPEIAELLNSISDSFQDPIRNSRRGVSAILSDYSDALIYEPEKIRQAAKEYCSIVGATCQQSASDKMASLKQLSNVDNTDIIEFDTVIIDEAARANPLDLFIPMSMARRRIILVGDHLQLPHLLDPEIESDLGKRLNLEKSQKAAMSQSLFERLLIQLRKMESIDNLPRVITLDTQYRMHPVLGEFISKNFYEKEEVPLKSGRLAENFAHTLPGYEEKVCAWLNVPFDDGPEEPKAGSKQRKVEAQRLAKELQNLMNAAPELSFGVITFYSSQRNLLMSELLPFEITERYEGKIRIRPALANDENGKERLCIGTVDAFQGKEFDVVLLSIVRSNRASLKSKTTEEQWNSRYGFLRLPNRMNVAMSRQCRLLIAVGDIEMASCDDARSAVPALYEFMNLCRGQYGTIR